LPPDSDQIPGLEGRRINAVKRSQGLQLYFGTTSDQMQQMWMAVHAVLEHNKVLYFQEDLEKIMEDTVE
jgi:hypothetical protein